MLNRLLKYDLRRTLKFLLIFMILALFFSGLTRLIGTFSDSLAMEIIKGICNGTAISMICSLFINCFMRSWVMFRSALYGDESYLTHTLPVKRESHYASKALAAMISLVVCMMATIGTLFVMYWSDGLKAYLQGFLQFFSQYLDVPEWSIVAFAFSILYLEFYNMLQCGFTGIILGHRFNHSKILFSVLLGFGAYMITQVFAILIMLVIGLMNSDMMKVFHTADFSQFKPDVLVAFALIGTALYLAFSIAGFVINARLLKKGVNVD